MRKAARVFGVFLMGCLMGVVILADAADAVPISVQRLSERVLVLTEDSPMENNVVAIATTRGIVVVDSTGSPCTAAGFRERIIKEFGRDDFALLINTHHHWDHAWGNQVFADLPVVGHVNSQASWRGAANSAAGMAERATGRIQAAADGLASSDPDSAEAARLRRERDFQTRIRDGLEKNFLITPPTISFTDEMTIYQGDITLKLIFFGRAHSGADILILIPEEKILLTGDIFLDQGWLPLFAGQTVLDIPRWLEVLEDVLSEQLDVQTVIPGHQRLWDRKKLVLWQGYISDLWAGVQQAKAEKCSTEEVIERFPLEEKYMYLKELNHSDQELKQYQERNVRAFWRQLFPLAATVLEETASKGDLAALKARLDEVRAAPDKYYFDERQFNQLGYLLLQRNEVKKAILIFRANVELYPQSGNVYDSLGEAYMTDGQKELAVENYRKALTLNPGNDNARQMLVRLGASPEFP